MTHDTAEFAVESIRRWWRLFGILHYPTPRRLFIGADSGGSNPARKPGLEIPFAEISDESPGTNK
jgi:hypothetical protein